MEDEILARDALGERALDGDAHVLARGLEQSLRRQDVLDLGRADAKRQSPERAVGGGVGIAAYHRGAGEGESLLGADDVHDALTAVVHAEVRQAEVLHVLLERHDLETGVRLLDEVLDRVEAGAIGGGDVVVHGHERAVGAADDASGGAKSLEIEMRREKGQRASMETECA